MPPEAFQPVEALRRICFDDPLLDLRRRFLLPRPLGLVSGDASPPRGRQSAPFSVWDRTRCAHSLPSSSSGGGATISSSVTGQIAGTGNGGCSSIVSGIARSAWRYSFAMSIFSAIDVT